jgi:hypothetical protein
VFAIRFLICPVWAIIQSVGNEALPPPIESTIAKHIPLLVNCGSYRRKKKKRERNREVERKKEKEEKSA